MSAAALEGRSPTQLALRRFGRNRRAIVSFWLLLALALSTIVVPWVSPHDFRTQKLEFQKRAPDTTYWMGTDPNGRDLMVRCWQLSWPSGAPSAPMSSSRLALSWRMHWKPCIAPGWSIAM